MNNELKSPGSYTEYIVIWFYVCWLVYDFTILIWMSVLIWRELKDRYLDVLRFILYVTIFIFFLRDIPTNIKIFIKFEYSDEMEIIDNLFNWSFLISSVNQLSNLVLIAHIEQYKKLLSNANFKQWRQHLRMTEVKLLTWVIVLNLLVILSMEILIVIPTYYPKTIGIALSVKPAILWSTWVYLIFVESYWFIRLKNIMKHNLNYYYTHNWGFMKWLMIWNILGFILIFVIYIYFSIWQVKLNEI